MDNKAIEAAAKVAWDRDERASEVASDWRGSNYKAVPWERASEVDKLEYLSDAQACIEAYLAASGDGEDKARLDWLERNLFERKWDGTIGRSSRWYVRGDYRHTSHRMKGETFAAAIDAARG